MKCIRGLHQIIKEHSSDNDQQYIHPHKPKGHYKPGIDYGIDLLTKNRVKSISDLSSSEGGSPKNKFRHRHKGESIKERDQYRNNQHQNYNKTHREENHSDPDYLAHASPRYDNKVIEIPSNSILDLNDEGEYNSDMEQDFPYREEVTRPSKDSRDRDTRDRNTRDRDTKDRNRIMSSSKYKNQKPESDKSNFDNEPSSEEEDPLPDFKRSMIEDDSDEDDDLDPNFQEESYGRPQESDIDSLPPKKHRKLTAQELYLRKKKGLKRLERLRRKGYEASKKFTLSSSLQEVEDEVEILEDE